MSRLLKRSRFSPISRRANVQTRDAACRTIINSPRTHCPALPGDVATLKTTRPATGPFMHRKPSSPIARPVSGNFLCSQTPRRFPARVKADQANRRATKSTAYDQRSTPDHARSSRSNAIIRLSQSPALRVRQRRSRRHRSTPRPGCSTRHRPGGLRRMRTPEKKPSAPNSQPPETRFISQHRSLGPDRTRRQRPDKAGEHTLSSAVPRRPKPVSTNPRHNPSRPPRPRRCSWPRFANSERPCRWLGTRREARKRKSRAFESNSL